MIKVEELTKQDVGRLVLYRDRLGHEEHGRLKGWSRTSVFVVFHCDNNWERWRDYTSMSCDPEDVEFMVEE